MAWTAEVKEVTKLNGTVFVVVRYADGTRFVELQHKYDGAPPAEWLENVCAKKLAQLEGMDSAAIVAGPVAAPTPPPTPPAEDLDEIAFMRNLRKVERVASLLEVGALKATDQQVIDFVAAVRSKLPTYWGLL